MPTAIWIRRKIIPPMGRAMGDTAHSQSTSSPGNRSRVRRSRCTGRTRRRWPLLLWHPVLSEHSGDPGANINMASSLMLWGAHASELWKRGFGNQALYNVMSGKNAVNQIGANYFEYMAKKVWNY